MVTFTTMVPRPKIGIVPDPAGLAIKEHTRQPLFFVTHNLDDRATINIEIPGHVRMQCGIQKEFWQHKRPWLPPPCAAGSWLGGALFLAEEACLGLLSRSQSCSHIIRATSTTTILRQPWPVMPANVPVRACSLCCLWKSECFVNRVIITCGVRRADHCTRK